MVSKLSVLPIDPVLVLSASELLSLLRLELLIDPLVSSGILVLLLSLLLSDGSVGGVPSSVCSPVNSTISFLSARLSPWCSESS
jgi:hypothetical protein